MENPAPTSWCAPTAKTLDNMQILTVTLLEICHDVPDPLRDLLRNTAKFTSWLHYVITSFFANVCNTTPVTAANVSARACVRGVCVYTLAKVRVRVPVLSEHKSGPNENTKLLHDTITCLATGP